MGELGASHTRDYVDRSSPLADGPGALSATFRGCRQTRGEGASDVTFPWSGLQPLQRQQTVTTIWTPCHHGTGSRDPETLLG